MMGWGDARRRTSSCSEPFRENKIHIPLGRCCCTQDPLASTKDTLLLASPNRPLNHKAGLQARSGTKAWEGFAVARHPNARSLEDCFELLKERAIVAFMSDSQWLEVQRAAFGLRMDSAGRFWRKGERFEHPRILAFLRRHLEMRGEQCVLQVGEQWVPLEVADTPLRVLSLRTHAETPHLELSLDDGRQGVRAALKTLRCDAQERISCLVESVSGSSWLRARLGNAALMEISEHIEGLEDAVPQWRFPDPAQAPLRLEAFYSR